MTKALLSFATIAALSSLASSPSFAGEPGAAYGGTVGALTLETRDLATNADQVRSQGGFATAGAVHWTQSPARTTEGRSAAF